MYDTLRLSDAFEKVEGFDEICLELFVKVYNINEGRNVEMAGRCEELRCYAYFVDRARYHEGAEKKRDPLLDEKAVTRIALRKAMQDCKDKSLLVDFWDNLSPEEVNMLGFEWDVNIAMEVEREEGIEEGIEKGIKKGIEEGIEKGREEVARNMLEKGFSCEQTAELSGLGIDRVRELLSGIT
jgi:flagellar biosynthesis/type III secretory pathway protein FliH